MSDFNAILKKYREISFSERDKGDRFERLMQVYLQTDPKYANVLQYVWLWNEFPAKMEFGGKDIGIDLVARTFDGEYWAIQCKCYQENSGVNKKSLDSFLSTSSKTFSNDENSQVGFSQRMWISTNNDWGSTAEETVKNQNPPFFRVNLTELQEAPVVWDKLEKGISGELARTEKKILRDHQNKALLNTQKHFLANDRGKLIMACGTGKTFTSLRIAENQTDSKGLILFLVPSIALLGQTLREWTGDAINPITPICICSDPKITRQRGNLDDTTNFSVVDLAMPASTDVKKIVKQFEAVDRDNAKGMTVVFSTYQSIEVIAGAQQEMLDDGNENAVFDLIICDEAHRTTGFALTKEDSSSFIKVHDNTFIQAEKRLYMTATPRLYHEDARAKADENDAILCSMDDPKVYGEEMYRIGFGEAVENQLLTDYKVLILTVNDQDVSPNIQKMLSGRDHEISSDDLSKLIGCVNALSKQVLGTDESLKNSDPEPMKKAVAFCNSIKNSKETKDNFNQATELYIDSLDSKKRNNIVSIAAKHIDGSMNAPQRDELLGWLKSTSADSNECRILSNVRCLSEGVDVPSLDAVVFLSPRNSQVDVVQSVGRVMRRSPGKKYGYIIIPVVVPSYVEGSKAMDKNTNFKVVWSVLNALRSHDDRFNATVNKIELNKKRPSQIIIGTSAHGDADDIDYVSDLEKPDYGEINNQLLLEFQELQGVMYAKLVEKVGDRVYWEKWAKDVADIAEKQISRIHSLIEEDEKHEKAFDNFLKGLQKNINPAINKEQAIEMLSQHIITKPVFEALFEGYSFVKNNPISSSMQSMLDVLEEHIVKKDTETLDRFYASVKKRAAGIDNAEGKQRIIIELYDKFFKTAFPKMVEQLGIVYTPVEVVDFIIHSVNDVLKKEFDRSISDENVHILDPFTGTGTFITRLLQSGLIKQKDLHRKYTQEIHANEIVLLAYYIAAVNIENAYHDLQEDKENYVSFDGICLTDTFQLGESSESEKLFSEMFPQNSERVLRQQKEPVRVIIGNPPYSVGQKSANDNAQNQKYNNLDRRIEQTYAKLSNANSIKALYDAYIKAFRWSSDRLDIENGGIIAFVSNGAWLEGNGMDGFRMELEKEFSSIYVFNLRGNQRTSGELSRKEGGKIFGSGSRTPISITILIKNLKAKNKKAKINYYDIGDYLSQEEKLKIISNYKSIDNLSFKVLKPNKEGDWVNQRNDSFVEYPQIEANKKYDTMSKSFFISHSLGTATSRDAWVYNFAELEVYKNMKRMISFYNLQRLDFQQKVLKNKDFKFDQFASTDSKKISWNDSLKKSCKKNIERVIIPSEMKKGLYRPFVKMNLYFDKHFIQRPYQQPKFFPTPSLKNRIICVSGIGGSKDYSSLISDIIPSLDTIEKAQCFPLYYYEKNEKNQGDLFQGDSEEEYTRKDGVSDFILKRAIAQYGKNVGKEDIFYYVYGVLHSPDYRETFANDLKKMLPRIPLVEGARDFWKFSKAGRALAELHLNYETVAPYPEVLINGEHLNSESWKQKGVNNFTVQKMRFSKKGEKDGIIYNGKIVVSNIPEKAYKYVVNGKSAIEWIMERYQVKTDKKSGIKNDPNDWAKEVDNPSYIIDLLLSIINVSVQTVDIVDSLPKMEFEG